MRKIFELLAAGVIGAAVLFALLIFFAAQDRTERLERPVVVEEPAAQPPVYAAPPTAYTPQEPAAAALAPGQWLRELLAIEKAAASVRALDKDGQFDLAMRASRAIGAVASMKPAPRGKYAELFCTMAIQALRNYVDDMRGDRPISAEEEMAVYRENKPKCVKAIRR